MRRERGTPIRAVRNLFAGEMPLARRASLVLRNWRARLGPPPRGCCGHPGEPGC